MKEVYDHTLPEPLETLAERYHTDVGLRDEFLWKWFHLLNPYFQLSSVDPAAEAKVRTDKTLLMFYLTLLDDLVEERDDSSTFQEAAHLPFDGSEVDFNDAVDERYLDLACDVWDEFERSVRRAPRYEAFRSILQYDLRQVVCGMRYSSVVNANPRMANLTEAYAYDSHTMAMLPFADLDLMHSPAFDTGELAALRRCLWTAQRMARIGNWVTTWGRELAEGDLSSGVLIRASERGLLSERELRRIQETGDEELVAAVRERIERSDVRSAFIEEWELNYRRLEAADRLASVDVDRLLDGMSVVLRFHLDSEGLK